MKDYKAGPLHPETQGSFQVVVNAVREHFKSFPHVIPGQI